MLAFFAFQHASPAFADQHYRGAVYTREYGLSFLPVYPPVPGETTTLRLRTFKPAQKVILYSDRKERISMAYREGHWWGEYQVPADYTEGDHFFTVWIKYPSAQLSARPEVPDGLFDGLFGWFKYALERMAFWEQTAKSGNKFFWVKSAAGYRAYKKETLKTVSAEADFLPSVAEELTSGEDDGFWLDEEKDEGEEYVFAEEEIIVPGTEEAAAAEINLDNYPLSIKGSQSITFKSRTLDGSREGYAAGTLQTREEALRINVAGKAAGTDIEATLYRTTATGIGVLGEREEEISILMRQGSTEAYLGDFTADFNETEFAKLDKALSGARVRGDYGGWGFNALYSSPKGETKFYRMYGDGTQGPYNLGNAPVVIDSERVYVDNSLQKRGDDYTVDYQAGTISFIKKVIDPKSIMQIYYDYRQTVYQHATYGLRAFVRPWENLKLGATYLEDSDSLAGAQEIRSSMSQEAIDPRRHFVVGADGSIITENFSADAEIAYSARNLDLLSSSATNETGKAGKLSLSSGFGPFGITAHFKKTGDQFRPISEPDPKQGLWEYGGALSFRPGALFGSKGDYAYQKYTQGGVAHKNIYRTAKAWLTPDKLPSLEYNFSETDESNDPVTGSAIQRVITRNSAEMIHRFGFFSASLKGAKEKWLQHSPSEEATDYTRINLGLAAAGLEKITFSSNVELEERDEPSGDRPYRRTYNLNLAATPSKQYFVSSSLQIVDDSAQGQTNVTDLAYRAQPSADFKTDGKYSIVSLTEDFPSAAEGVSKQSGSFSFDLRPYSYLRLKYLFKPNFTVIARTQTLSYNNEQQQAEINLIPAKYALLGFIYKLGRSFNICRDNYPDYTVKENTGDTNSTLYTLKMAPLQMLSMEFNHFQENSFTTTLASTQEPYTYTQGRGATRKIDAIVRTSLSEKFSIDSRYTFQKTDQGTGEGTASSVDTKSHAISLKSIWNPVEMWSFSLSGAYSRTSDYLLSQVTYTFSPGAGIIYRLGETLRIDLDYTYSKSYAGAETEISDYSLKTRYSLSDFVSLTLQWEREISRAPDYSLTDITGNVEIAL